MEEINAQLKELQNLLQSLIKRYNSLKKENEHLQKLNKELSASLLEKENELQTATQKLEAGDLVAQYDFAEKKQLQQRIDVYLKDIEKCLSLLNA